MMTMRPKAAFVLLSVLLAGGCASQPPVETIRADGDFLYRHGNFADAADEYARIVARYPGDWEGQYRL